MTESLQIILASEQAKQIIIPDYDPLSDEVLDQITREMRKGLLLHNLLSIKPDDPRPLPVHVHPAVILSMIQEIKRSREA